MEFMDKADKNTLKSVWVWLKYVMIPPTLIWLCYHELLFEFFGNNAWLLFVVGASICNATMDTLSHHYDTSIFKKKNKRFWSPLISSDEAIRIGSYKVDAWHLIKSLMIISICFAVVFYSGKFFWIDFCFAGYFWNISFSLFYDIILRRK